MAIASGTLRERNCFIILAKIRRLGLTWLNPRDYFPLFSLRRRILAATVARSTGKPAIGIS